MRRDGQKANFFPMRWFIAEMINSNPETVVTRDATHLSPQYRNGMAAGILTALTGGRCFVGDEPAGDTDDEAWQTWHAQLTGYALMYRMSALKERAPCFQVKPSTNNTDLAPGPQSIAVRFLLPPLATVVVDVTASVPGVTIEPAQLYFMPHNHAGWQTVTVTSTGVAPAATPVLIQFRARSTDSAYDELFDEWDYLTGTATSTDSPTGAPSELISFRQPTSSPVTQKPSAAPPSAPPSVTPNYCPEGYINDGTRYNWGMGRITIVSAHEQCSDRCTQFSGVQFAGGCKAYMSGMYYGLLFCRSYGGDLRNTACASWAAPGARGVGSGFIGSIHPITGQRNLGGNCCTNTSFLA